jgi:hypothetical protein
MSDLRLNLSALPPTNEPLRMAVRRMRWFRQAFRAHAEATGREIGCTFSLDEARLGGVFVRWLRAVQAQKPTDKAERRAFFEFAASLMLRELTADMPLTADAPPSRVPPGSAGAFWPEGYACVMFCLSVHTAAMAEEFAAAPDIAPAVEDLRHWWSFRENAAEDARFSAAFLQMLLGHAPNWSMPDVFRERLQAEAMPD